MTTSTVCHDRLDAELYSSLHRGTPGDVEFYLSECAGARTILELGSGYGRLGLPLARAGHRVTGLELDPWLLRKARSSAQQEPARTRSGLRWLTRDMTRFDLGQRFDRVVIAHSTLYCLGSNHSLASCLACARQHLGRDGVLLIDAYAADGFHRRFDAYPVDVPQSIVRFSVGRSIWEVWEHSRWSAQQRRFTVKYVCRRLSARPLDRTLTVRHRYRLRPEIEVALARAGFHQVEVCGGFHGEPYGRSADTLVVRARG